MRIDKLCALQVIVGFHKFQLRFANFSKDNGIFNRSINCDESSMRNFYFLFHFVFPITRFSVPNLKILSILLLKTA